MEEQIKKFLSIGYGDGDGSGDGYGYGYGYGYGSGSGYGSGYGYGSGDGYGYGYGDGYGDGDGYGSGDGYGYGSGYGSGDGSGYGSGDGSGYGSGDGSGYGIKMIAGDTVHMIDGIPTVIKQLHGNIAKGYAINSDLTTTPTFVVKQGNKFAHGSTLRDANDSLHEKLFDDSTEEERLKAFEDHFPDFHAMYPAKELFHWHHILTGSCRQGRELFCVSHDINIETDMFNIYQFINLTRNSYGGETIQKLVPKQKES